MRASRKNLYEINIWPGFVDVLGTLLIVTIFTVLISTVTQIYFNDQLEIKRGEISSLDSQITSLANQLNLLNIEKKKIDSINFKAKVIVKDKSQLKSNEKVYILINRETKLDSTISNIKEKFLNKKEALN